jgi:hypothetical protein
MKDRFFHPARLFNMSGPVTDNRQNRRQATAAI